MRSFTPSQWHLIARNLFIGMVLMGTVCTATWPLVLHLHNSAPIGTEHELTVPLFNTWTLWWVADRAAHGFENFWQAPIFYPSEGTFTFSEPQPLTGLLVFPFWKLFDSPVPIYNIAVLLFLFLNGIFAYRLGRGLQIPWLPSLIGGILMVGLPVTAKLLGVLHLIPVFGLLWALEGFIRFGEEGSWKMAIWAGAGLLVQLLVSQQLVLLFGLFAVTAGILALSRQEFIPMAVLRLGSVGLGVLLLTGWYAWYPVQLHQTLDFTRSDTIVQALSAHPSDYLSKPLTATFAFPPKEGLNTDTGGLFPGFGIMVLAGWGAFIGLRRGEMREWSWFFLGAGCLAFIFSLGRNSPLDGGALFMVLREWIPGFHELRSPFRFAVLVQVFLVLLSLNGLAGLSRFLLPSANIVVVCLVGSLSIAENLTVPQPLDSPGVSWKAPWVAWLTGQADRKIIGHVPFPGGLHVADYQIETERMLAQTMHHKPLINGYSGFFPPGYDRFQLDMAKNFPSGFLMCFLRQTLNVDTLIIDRPWYDTHQEQVAQFEELDEVLHQDDAVVILELRQTDRDCHREKIESSGL